MGLRKQLLTVALSTLLLPWAGCQYVQEMEEVLRNNLSDALTEQSQILVQAITRQALPPVSPPPIFYTPLRYQTINVDGYADDWQYHVTQPIQTRIEPTQARLQSAVHKQRLYLFLSIRHPDIHYYHPGLSYKKRDHIRILTKGNQQHRQWVLFTSGPGAMQVHELISGRIRASQHINAWWEETHHGFDLEISIPQSQILETFDIGVYLTPDQPASDRSPSAILAVSTQQDGASHWLKPQPALTALIASQRREDRDAVIVDPQGWPLSEQRDWLSESVDESAQPPPNQQGLFNNIISRFYRYMVMSLTPHNSHAVWPFQSVDISSQQYRFPLETLSLPKTRARSDWYQLPNSQQSILLSIEPIIQDDTLKGYLMLTKTGEGLISLTNQALRKVTHYTLFMTLIVIAVLLLFASSLSWRIRRLKSATESAVNTEGKITAFTPSMRQDEIGDLSRSYHTLLTKVRQYTDYLETLNGKLAHELRTPLTIVKSSLEMAQQGGDVQLYLQRASEGSERLRQILSAMSEGSRVEQAIQNTDFAPFSVHDVVEPLWSVYRDTYPDHTFEYQFTAPPTSVSPPLILGSPDLLAQLLDKLIENARSFAPAGSTIRAILQTDASQLHLSVENQGPTLPEQIENRLFDSLVSRRDQQENDATPHLGLGLYIARLICQAHKGTITARNREDRSGVVFTIQLPLHSI